ncbi:uncharacterized protein LOC141656272 [Silene latifolia]|uniref:uncharacterized protein LOC141656272 n=1 Tax=Silene latifolia TaxID=37657 RepID=UPI003D78A4A2
MEDQVEEESSPWQSLDLDDSDIISSFSLRRCSRLPQSPSPPCFRRIPGPAAAIQAAMHRKDHFEPPLNSNRNNNSDVNEISTQEYIRRIQDDDSTQEFTRNPWLFALHSLRPLRATSLKDINNCVNVQRFDTVVAVVKSCTPNGLGDMILTMKDPTATISASVHRKVLSTGVFGKLITAGSILILQKVVAFPSSCESCYLNITSKNVVKVISVDCEVQYFQDTNLDDTQVIEKADERYSTNTSRSEYMESSAYKISKEPILSDLVDSGHRAFGSLDQWRENSGRAAQPDSEAVVAAANCEDQASNVGSTPSTSDNYANQHAWQKHGPELQRMLTGKFQNRLRNPDSRISSASDNHIERDRCTSNDTQKHGPVGPQIGINSGPSLVDSLMNREIANPNDGKRCTQMRDIQLSVDLKQYDPENAGPGGLKKQRTGLISRASVQEWTDEQLCVLEMDDD